MKLKHKIYLIFLLIIGVGIGLILLKAVDSTWLKKNDFDRNIWIAALLTLLAVAIANAFHFFVNNYDRRKNQENLDDLSLEVKVLKEKNNYAQPITGIIETIYVHSAKINEIFSQISPSLKLAKVEKEKSCYIGMKGKLGNGLVGASIDNNDNIKTNEIYEKAEQADTSIVKEVVNYLKEKNNIVHIYPIKNIDERVENLEKASKTFINERIFFDHKIFHLVKYELEENSSKKITNNLKEGSFVLIQNEVQVLKQENNLKINSIDENSFISFESKIPIEGISDEELNQLIQYNTWELNLFGKIMRITQNKQNKFYSINCLALFRSS